MIVLYMLLILVALGSFANTIISYFSGLSDFDIGRSKCFCGKNTLKSYELFPVASYIFLKGKCSFCGMIISPRYVFVEAFVPILGLILYNKYGLSITIVVELYVFYLLFIIGVVDLLTYKIPNLLVLILFISASTQLLLKGWARFSSDFVSALLVFVILNSIYFVGAKYFKKAIFGYGDVKLLSVGFLMFGFLESLVALWLASIIGLVVYYLKIQNNASIENRIPFGFCMFWGFLLSNLYMKDLLNYYINIMGL